MLDDVRFSNVCSLEHAWERPDELELADRAQHGHFESTIVLHCIGAHLHPSAVVSAVADRDKHCGLVGLGPVNVNLECDGLENTELGDHRDQVPRLTLRPSHIVRALGDL